MGHSWREMDSVGSERHDNKIDLGLKIKEAIKHEKIHIFECCDLPLITDLFNPYPIGPNSINLDSLKEFAKKYNIDIS
jgi:hypothetical protein